MARSTLPVRGKLMRRPDLFALPDFRRNLTTARVSTRRWNQGLSETGSCDGRSKTSLTTHTVVEIQEFIEAGGIVVSDEWLLFTKFCRQGPRIGSLIPSSRWITREMLKGIDFSDARCMSNSEQSLQNCCRTAAELLQHACAKCKTVIVERDPARLESNSSSRCSSGRTTAVLKRNWRAHAQDAFTMSIYRCPAHGEHIRQRR